MPDAGFTCPECGCDYGFTRKHEPWCSHTLGGRLEPGEGDVTSAVERLFVLHRKGQTNATSTTWAATLLGSGVVAVLLLFLYAR